MGDLHDPPLWVIIDNERVPEDSFPSLFSQVRRGDPFIADVALAVARYTGGRERIGSDDLRSDDA